MGQQFGALASLRIDLNSVPSTHAERLTAAYNPRGSYALFSLPWSPAHIWSPFLSTHTNK